MTFRTRRLALGLLLSLATLLGACGQKGPLYLPGEGADDEQQETSEAAGKAG